MDRSNKDSSNPLSLSEIDELTFSPQTIVGQEQEMEEFAIEDYAIMDVAFSSIASSSTRKVDLEVSTTKINDDSSTTPTMLLRVEEREENVESKLDRALNVTDVVTMEADASDEATDMITQGQIVNLEAMALEVNDNQLEHAKRKISTHPQHKRLKGWLIIEKPRPKNDRIDKFYVHILSDVRFRSLNEVDDFIRLGLHPIRRTRGEKLDEIGKEGTSKKRLGKRKLVWIFQIRGLRSDCITKVYDIKFLQPNVDQDDPNNIHESPTSSEGTISDFGSEDEQDAENTWRKNKEKVETFLREAYENMLNSRVVASHENHLPTNTTFTKNGKRPKFEGDNGESSNAGL